MRRALVVAAVALPVAALAAVPAGIGQVLEVDNFNADTQVQSSYVNRAQCDGANLRLEWNIQPLGGTTFGENEQYRIFASNTPPSGENGTFCPEEPDENTTPDTIAGQVTLPKTAVRLVETLEVPGNLVVQTAGRQCDDASEAQVVHLCVHWYAGSTRRGWAIGEFIIQRAAPAAPTNVSAGVGDTRLKVSWSAGDGGAVTADRYVASATPVDAAGVPTGAAITSDEVTGTTVTISGLTNGTRYSVVVRALSVGRNPSEDSVAVIQTPQLVDDFWESYLGAGGQEQGGCGTGPGGSIALLAVAGLLAALRRRP